MSIQPESRTAANTPYNHARQKSVHNAFQRAEGIADQFLYWRVRSLEVDVHHADVFGNTTKGDWSVHHDWYDPISTVSKLSQFLATVRGLNRLVPDHEVLTLFIDIKDPFPRSARAAHGWVAFDELLDRHLGSVLFRPADLARTARGAKSLRAALGAKGWPTLDRLRGRVIAVLTGSPTQLANYATSTRSALRRAAFVSAPVDRPSDIPGHGDQVFFNINGETNMGLVDRVDPLGYIARVYYLNTYDLWRNAARARAHHLGTDKVNERIDRWAATRGPTGYPFCDLTGKDFADTEPGATAGLWARTDDMWGDHDSFWFNYSRRTSRTIDQTYDLAIAGANSMVEDWAKGAVMARAGLEPDAPYFAVVRPGQKHGLRVQFRGRAGGPTAATSPMIGPAGIFGHDIDQDTIVHVRLKVDRGGRRARAWGSYDRSGWVPLGAVEFGDLLRYHGLAVSSHGQRRGAKMLFVPAKPSRVPLFDQSTLIGGDNDHDGWTDWSDTARWLPDRFNRWSPLPDL